MHLFDYDEAPRRLLTPQVVAQLGFLHEQRARQAQYAAAAPELLTALVDAARIQSTGASNRIEGICTSDRRLEALVARRAEPRNRSEAEIAGYREVLNLVHESYRYIAVRSGNILQLHRDLLAYSHGAAGGHFKTADNVISGHHADGTERVRFVPVPAFQTADAVDALCAAHDGALGRGQHDALLLTFMFVLDFLCIHPFADGNGRISRLLTLLLLYRQGYDVGRYISLEMLVEQTKDEYYAALQASSQGWHEGTNDYAPFVAYSLGVVARAYGELERRVGSLQGGSLSKTQRVRAVFDERVGLVRKADILAHCPDISVTTVERVLKALLDEGYVAKQGRGRATGYVKR